MFDYILNTPRLIKVDVKHQIVHKVVFENSEIVFDN